MDISAPIDAHVAQDDPLHPRNAPYIVEPALEHKQSFIVLHGRGSNASSFGPAFLAPFIGPSSASLPQLFPHAKFICPTATPRRARRMQRVKITQWFDIWNIRDDPDMKPEDQVEGLNESVGRIHDLLRQEIAIVGAENVVLGGLSQGCATALIALLLWEGERLGAVFGMCGWLPFARAMVESAAMDDQDEMFERDGFKPPKSTGQQMVASLHEALDREMSEVVNVPTTPIILGHGSRDEKVPCRLGQTAAETMTIICMQNVEWKIYDGLGHWYSDAMLQDIVEFIYKSTGWKRPSVETKKGWNAIPRKLKSLLTKKD